MWVDRLIFCFVLGGGWVGLFVCVFVWQFCCGWCFLGTWFLYFITRLLYLLVVYLSGGFCCLVGFGVVLFLCWVFVGWLCLVGLVVWFMVGVYGLVELFGFVCWLVYWLYGCLGVCIVFALLLIFGC